jgi:hypothetical protein
VQRMTAMAAWLAATAGLGISGCGAAKAVAPPPLSVEAPRPEVPCAEAPAPSSPAGSAPVSAPPAAEEPAKAQAAEEPLPPEPPPSAANIGGDEGDEESARAKDGNTPPQSAEIPGR